MAVSAEHATNHRQLHSGMSLLPPRELKARKELHRIHNRALRADKVQAIGSTARHASLIANSVGNIRGIELIQRADYEADNHNRCAHFVFGTVKGEEWAQPGALLEGFWDKPQLAFLQEQGFDVIQESPRAGDIIAYAKNGEAGQAQTAQLLHFGVLMEDGSVTSKFNQGPVVNHPVDLVPTGYGDTAYFLRKSEPEAQLIV